ncbi:hypothetical protein BpHYR1_014189 [Brachionus plicatilis]|uniref:Uncharacterized protein n=1 Tax=Brachionus plicatilis TaxID=10195 RepID=A0A3M7S9Z6_BRAPC|nr:hypothetical protein BpHYR1_014189 [Brachionus plicatilis]
MITNNPTENGSDIFQILENMQRSMNQISTNLEHQQNQIITLSSQQNALQITIPNSSLACAQVDYPKMMRSLVANKYTISNFVPRDKHEIDFLARMLEDYEHGLLPIKTKEAWQEQVSILNSVAENGWPVTVQKIRESKANLSALISPRQMTQIYSPNQKFRIGNGYGKSNGKWRERVNQRKF